MRSRANLKSLHSVNREMHQHKQHTYPIDEEDPDHSLIHSYPPPLIRRSRLDYKSITQTGENVAFSYVQQPEEKNVLLPGLSSAAACIVLELPRQPGTACSPGRNVQICPKARNDRPATLISRRNKCIHGINPATMNATASR